MKYIIENKEQFWQYQEAFRQLSRGKLAAAEDHILYNLMRGKDLKRGFTPITNEKKLNADYYKRAYLNFELALNSLKSSIRHRVHINETYTKYGQAQGCLAPLTMRHGETITEQQWDEILKVLGEYK